MWDHGRRGIFYERFHELQWTVVIISTVDSRDVRKMRSNDEEKLWHVLALTLQTSLGSLHFGSFKSIQTKVQSHIKGDVAWITNTVFSRWTLVYLMINTEGKDFPLSLLGVPVVMQNVNAIIKLAVWMDFFDASSDFSPFIILCAVRFVKISNQRYQWPLLHSRGIH